MVTSIKSEEYKNNFDNTVKKSLDQVSRNADNVHFLYNKEKQAIIEIEVLGDYYKLTGIKGTILSHIDKTVDRAALLEFKNIHGLLHEKELGQVDLFECL